MSNAIPIKRPSAVTSEIVRLTPQDAVKLLEHNTHNRPISEGDVLKWASEMESGRWQMNGEAIKISRDGAILDGQHRLQALSLCPEGTAIEVLIIRGLPIRTQQTMDQGRKRSPSDQLNLAGVEADRSLAAAVKFYIKWAEGLLFVDRKDADAQVTTTRIVEWGLNNEESLALMRRAQKYRNIMARNGLLYAAYARIAEATTHETADEFFQSVLDGISLPSGSPIVALRAKLTKLATDRVRISDRDMLGYFLQSFNHWIAGRSVAKLQRPHGGTWTKDNFPEINA